MSFRLPVLPGAGPDMRGSARRRQRSIPHWVASLGVSLGLLLVAPGFGGEAGSTARSADGSTGEGHPAEREGGGSRSGGVPDLSAFRIIAERNIFNASRSGGRVNPARATRRPARVETLALVGTLEAGTNRIAFFDGSDRQFRQAVRPGGRVAGLTVEEIRFDKVYVVQDTQRWELPVGRALRREDEGEWRLADAVGLPAAEPSGPVEPGSGRESAAASAPAVSAEAAEVLRKLMERRAREEQ